MLYFPTMKYLLIFLLFLSACYGPQSTAPSMPATTPSPVSVPISLKQVVFAFKAVNLPMTAETIFDERTDPNGLLGRPGRYVEKMNFTDKRIKEKRNHCSIEIFQNYEDALNRYQYVEVIGRTDGMLDSYKFLHKNVLVRINLDLIPSEADEYKRILETL